MKSNIILLIIGFIIVIIPFIISFIFKEKKDFNRFEYNNKHKKSTNTENSHSKVENQIIYERIKRLEQEVLRLKLENSVLVKEFKDENLSNENNSQNNSFSFKPVLNYNLFKEKNSNIINMYNEGQSKEEIAKSLNKSVREIEMVIKLVK